MPGVPSPYQRLAEANGATIVGHISTGLWIARDNDGAEIVCGALSAAEAARLYCEDKDLTPATHDAILARILAEFRPYNAHPAFKKGYRVCQAAGAACANPYVGAAAQALDRGTTAALLYRRALAHLDECPNDANPETAAADWLVRIIRDTGSGLERAVSAGVAPDDRPNLRKQEG
jgi:hypothetical protein